MSERERVCVCVSHALGNVPSAFPFTSTVIFQLQGLKGNLSSGLGVGVHLSDQKSPLRQYQLVTVHICIGFDIYGLVSCVVVVVHV